MNKYIGRTICTAVLTLLFGSQAIAAPQKVLRTPQSVQPYQVQQQPIAAMPSLQPGAPVVTYHNPNSVIAYTPQMFEVTSSATNGALSGNNQINITIVSWYSPNPKCLTQLWTAATEVAIYIGPAEGFAGPVYGDPTGGGTARVLRPLGPPASRYCSIGDCQPSNPYCAKTKVYTVDVINQNEVSSICSTAAKGANLLVKQKVLTYVGATLAESVVFDVLVHCPH
ncbi:MAG: hypothetical protein A2X79_08485 [Desulfuromonadaceae bacterium GWB2_53_15]|nr:MAG: hypothetical protein A2X79_08485 [Desulfuromonadaceae bacterium GWB2_53_15]